jgi:hypothetical protein
MFNELLRLFRAPQISNAPLKNLGSALEILGCAKQSRLFMHGVYAYAP